MFVATINIPGYLPDDTDPPTFETAREAWEYLTEERQRYEEDLPEPEWSDTANDLMAAAHSNAWDGERFIAEVWDIDRNGEGFIWGASSDPERDSAYDLGYVYSVTKAELESGIGSL